MSYVLQGCGVRTTYDIAAAAVTAFLIIMRGWGCFDVQTFVEYGIQYKREFRETSQKFAHDFVDRTAFLNNNESKHATIDPPAEHVRGVVPRVCVMSARVRVE